jgi:hypothetical protein
MALTCLDMIGWGSYLFSALVCPIWFTVAVVLALLRRLSPRAAAAYLAMPVLIAVVVFGNSCLQQAIARANAARVVDACESYRRANGSYPGQLEDLIPRYLPSIPRAKYCCILGEFGYYGGHGGNHLLWWYDLPPTDRWVYNLERGTCRFVD